MNELSQNDINELTQRRLHRIKDNRLLRRLPWHRARKDIVLNRIGKAQIPNDIDTKTLRAREGLSQADFATIYAIPMSTIRAWEAGKNKGTQSLLYLRLIEAAPQTVRRSLGLKA